MKRKFNLIDAFEFVIAGIFIGWAIAYFIIKNWG